MYHTTAPNYLVENIGFAVVWQESWAMEKESYSDITKILVYADYHAETRI